MDGFDKDVAMRCRRPSFVQRALEFHRANQQTWHISTVGVFAADSDFANTREIVFVFLFDIRAGKIANRPFELIRREFIALDGLRFANRAQRAAAITTQPHMHTDSLRPFFELSEFLSDIAAFIQRGKHDAVE